MHHALDELPGTSQAMPHRRSCAFRIVISYALCIARCCFISGTGLREKFFRLVYEKQQTLWPRICHA
jgi:hypothetical protein